MVALPNLGSGDPGRWRQVERCPPKSAQFWAKNSQFSPKTALVRVQNSKTKARPGQPQKAPFSAKKETEGKQLLHSTCGLTFL